MDRFCPLLASQLVSQIAAAAEVVIRWCRSPETAVKSGRGGASGRRELQEDKQTVLKVTGRTSASWRNKRSTFTSGPLLIRKLHRGRGAASLIHTLSNELMNYESFPEEIMDLYAEGSSRMTAAIKQKKYGSSSSSQPSWSCQDVSLASRLRVSSVSRG